MDKYRVETETSARGFLTVALQPQAKTHEWVVTTGSPKKNGYFLLESVAAPETLVLSVSVYMPDHVGDQDDGHTSVLSRKADEATDFVTFPPGVAVPDGGRIKIKTHGESHPTLIGRIAK